MKQTDFSVKNKVTVWLPQKQIDYLKIQAHLARTSLSKMIEAALVDKMGNYEEGMDKILNGKE